MPNDYAAITKGDDLKRLVDKLMKDEQTIGFDIETGYHGAEEAKRSLDPFRNILVGFSITNDPAWARYVPLLHDFGPNIDTDPDEVMTIIKPVLEELPVVAHHMKFEKRNMRVHGDIEINVKSDSMIESFMLSEVPPTAKGGDDLTGAAGLKPQVEFYFDHKMLTMEDLFPGLTKKQMDALRFNVLDVNPRTTHYACEDASWCLALHQRNYDKAMAQAPMLFPIELEISGILSDMEDVGIPMDWDLFTRAIPKARKFIDKQLSDILNDLSAMAGTTISINVNSSPQLGKVLFEILGMKSVKTTKGGKPSTDAVALEALSRQYPVVKKILVRRELEALTVRYLEKWPREYAKAPDKRGHPSYKQCAVGTGRFAVADPAIQQMPKISRHIIGDEIMEDIMLPDVWEKIPDERKFEVNVRDLVRASPNHYILDFDYAQIELRVMAGLAQEPSLIETFNNDGDPHTTTAAVMLNKPVEDVTKLDRQIGKTMNFALLYGMGVKSLADRLAVTPERAQELYDGFFAAFTAIDSWQERAKQEGRRRGHTISWANRKYTVWELQSSNRAIYSKGERVLVNAPVQGGAADYMKIAMVRVSRKLKKMGLWMNKVRLIMNNHDALTFEVHESIDPVWLMNELRPAVEFKVEGLPKITSEWEYGPAWGSMSDVKVETLTPIAQPTITVTKTTEPTTAEVQQAAQAVELPKPPEPEPIPPAEHDGSQINIEFPEMPTIYQFDRIQELAHAHPGSTAVTLITPEGQVETGWLISQSAIEPMRMAVPQAQITQPTETIDVSTLMEGLTL